MSLLRLVGSNDFKIVVLDSPYDSLTTPEAKKLFSAFIDLKLRGYGCEYPYGAMPVDTTDFIAAHIGVFRVEGSEYIPVAAYKSISEKKCRLHGVPFSGLQVPASSGAHQVVKAVEGLVERSQREGSFLTYEGGWTIDPEIRKDPGLITEIHNLSTCMHVSQHLRYAKMDSICCGLLRFKTDRIMRAWGYQPLSLDGQPLEPFKQASLKGEPVLMHHASRFSEEALQIARDYRHYWENRIQIGEALYEAPEVAAKKAA